jgi:hypothetical protein
VNDIRFLGTFKYNKDKDLAVSFIRYDLKYLDKLNPNYKDVRALIDEAQFKGTDFVHVYTKK